MRQFQKVQQKFAKLCVNFIAVNSPWKFNLSEIAKKKLKTLY